LRITEAAAHDSAGSKARERECVSQVAALWCFGHRQIMPDLSSSETHTKPYENRLHRMLDTRFSPTLKPEDPKY
jgi:hypothetical protein